MIRPALAAATLLALGPQLPAAAAPASSGSAQPVEKIYGPPSPSSELRPDARPPRASLEPPLRPATPGIRPQRGRVSRAAPQPAATRKRRPQRCSVLPAPTSLPWKAGERLAFDIDVMGAAAGSFSMMVLPSVGVGTSKEHVFRALAASNSFFSKVRRVRGRSTSYVRSRDMQPRRYEEMSEEGGSHRSATVVFPRAADDPSIQLDWIRDKRKGKRRLERSADAFDPLSAAYFLRTIELEEGAELCFESYGIRRLWRVEGKVVGLEEVRVPAGAYKAWHIQGKATRVDAPNHQREIHIWISDDEARLPVAALGVIDLGAVRAQLTHVGSGPAANEAQILADLERRTQQAPPPPAPSRPRVR